MKKFYVISNYCSIRNKVVMIKENIVYTGSCAGFREFSNDIYRTFSLSYPKFHKMDNLNKLGFLSVELLLRDKNLNQKYAGDEIGIILMNASSSLDTDRCHQNSITDHTNYFPSPSVFVYTLPNVVIGEISIRHKIFGEGNFFITEKFNPNFLVTCVEQLLDYETTQCCIAGWVEINGNDYESIVFLIEKPDRTEEGIVNFEAANIYNIYIKKK